MAKQIISTGSAANDGTGDTLRSAGTKINANFTELYSMHDRGTANKSSGVLANGADGTINFTGLGKSFALHEIKPDRAAYIRLYTHSAARTADAARGELATPLPDNLIYEVVTIGDSAVRITPSVVGMLDSSVGDDTIAIAVKNKSGGSSAVNVRIKALPLEST